MHRRDERAMLSSQVHHFFAINRTAPRAATNISIVPRLRPPMPEEESNADAAVLLAGVVIVTPFGPTYVVVGAMTREPICVHEFKSEFNSF